MKDGYTPRSRNGWYDFMAEYEDILITKKYMQGFPGG